MAQGERLLAKCDLNEWMNTTKKCQTVIVELLERGDRTILQIKKKSKDEIILQMINCDNIGAMVGLKVDSLSSGLFNKKVPRNALVIFYKGETTLSEWKHLILLDTSDTPSSVNSVMYIRQELTKYCVHYQYPLKAPNPEDASKDDRFLLQVFRLHIVLVPDDQYCKDVSLVYSELASRVTGWIYQRSESDRVLLNLDNAPTPTTLRPTFRSCDPTVYELCDNKTVDMIISDLGLPPIRQLPTPPLDDDDTLPPTYDRPNGLREEESDCGRIPDIDEEPFWLREGEEEDIYESSPYSSVAALKRNKIISESESDYVSRKAEHIKTVCSRQSSVRFQEFVDRVQIQPEDIPQMVIGPVPSIYNRPRMSTLGELQGRALPNRTDAYYASNKVESTLASFLIDWPNIEPFPELTESELNIFCGRLDLVESRGLKGGWQDFATDVMVLSADDIQMFDECSCKYRVQVVQLILYHWLKLYNLEKNSYSQDKCKCFPTKENIIRQLKRMEKRELLYKLEWQDY